VKSPTINKNNSQQPGLQLRAQSVKSTKHEALNSTLQYHGKKKSLRSTVMKLAVIVHACNPSILETEAGGLEFKANLSYTARSCLKKQNKIKTPPQKKPRQ
jgi:hypothetical protein